jgi:fructose-1-phosphate kinase PfkB-like protein
VSAPNVVKKRNTVGAGDRARRRNVWALSQKKAKEVIRQRGACGSAATMNEGHSCLK